MSRTASVLKLEPGVKEGGEKRGTVQKGESQRGGTRLQEANFLGKN